MEKFLPTLPHEIFFYGCWLSSRLVSCLIDGLLIYLSFVAFETSNFSSWFFLSLVLVIRSVSFLRLGACERLITGFRW